MAGKKETAKDRAARLAAARAAQRKAERRRNLLMAAGVVLTMVLLVVGGIVLGNLTGGDKPRDTAAAGDAGSVTIGPDGAAHKVVIYEDFLCPYCGELEKQTHEKLAELAEAGKVQVEYRPFDLLQTDYSETTLEVFQAIVHGDAEDAQTVAKAFHDALYADQPSESGPFPSTDDIVATAVDAGADESAIRDALDGDAPTWADEATSAAESAGVRSTPTVLLDGSEFTSGSSVDDLAAGLIAAVS
ncbi:MAG: thioredoxin domain-containing protein [Nocardioides sp.]|uniref:DsbA family protein n=1 Tax=Nocardioides sp. TaxID=35761 RepID=UPI0039E64179